MFAGVSSGISASPPALPQVTTQGPQRSPKQNDHTSGSKAQEKGESANQAV